MYLSPSKRGRFVYLKYLALRSSAKKEERQRVTMSLHFVRLNLLEYALGINFDVTKVVYNNSKRTEGRNGFHHHKTHIYF
jgi:hypothetical protein